MCLLQEAVKRARFKSAGSTECSNGLINALSAIFSLFVCYRLQLLNDCKDDWEEMLEASVNESTTEGETDKYEKLRKRVREL